jgi:2-polyprenyl-3-methyl-5-hydroxy-6-metoxy-1,4-benzoquinol methylase
MDDKMSLDALRLRFAVPKCDDSNFTETDKTMLARLYQNAAAYREQIEQTTSGSGEREKLISEMYAKSWAFTAASDAYTQYAGNTEELTDRTKDALSLLRLSGARRVLEVGVGQGALADALAGQGCFVDGIDVTSGLQWDAIQARHSGRVHLWTGAVGTASESTYELCIADNVLEHVPSGDYEMFLDSCYRALKPGGWLVVCIPNPLTGPHDCSRWFSQPGEPATGDHFNERTMRQLKTDFRSAGFRHLKTTIVNNLSSGRKRMGWEQVWVWRALMFEQYCARVAPARRMHPVFRYTIPRTLAGQKPARS